MLRSVRERLRNRRRRPPPVDADNPKQPRVFRNRSLDYAPRPRRWFNRSRRPATPPQDRPTPAIPPPATSQRNDDSFSSLPSTHASRDPFLNDDVPVEISRIQPREDRPRVAQETGFGLRLGHPESPPVSGSSASTSRKRSSLWKRAYDPEAVQSSHERDILRAVQLSEVCTKEKSVSAAEKLVELVDTQVRDMSNVLTAVSRQVESAKQIANSLPSSRDARFQSLLYTPPEDDGKSEAERVFLELHWTERVWDLEALLAEKRYNECVLSVEKLEADGMASGSPRTVAKFSTLRAALVEEMSAMCASDAPAATVFAPLLAKLGVADQARQVVLEGAQQELEHELNQLSSGAFDFAPRLANMLLDKTLAVFRKAHNSYSSISAKESNSSSFVAWIVEQSDFVYTEFISPVLTRARKNDPVTILATIEATRHRKYFLEEPLRQDEKSLVALLETRMTTHLRNELDGPVRDAEKQLIERAKTYASAIPRNWRDGPYQSGKAICDEFNVLSRGLEGALMELGTEADMLTGNLLIRPALIYCTTLLEMGTKAVREQRELTLSDVQEGVFETFTIIGKTILRLHQRFAKIPMLERVAAVLMSPNLGEVRILQSEMIARKQPSLAEKAPSRPSVQKARHVPISNGEETAKQSLRDNSSMAYSAASLSTVRDGGLGLLTYSEFGKLKEPASNYEDQARRLLAQQRAQIH